jgi:hypothetical protein
MIGAGGGRNRLAPGVRKFRDGFARFRDPHLDRAVGYDGLTSQAMLWKRIIFYIRIRGAVVAVAG